MSSLNVALTSDFIRGKFDSAETQFKTRMKKMAARMLRPKTKKVVIGDDSFNNFYAKSHLTPRDTPNKEFMYSKDLMDTIGFTLTTLGNWINRGTFPKPTKKEGRLRLWKTMEVQNWIDNYRKINH